MAKGPKIREIPVFTKEDAGGIHRLFALLAYFFPIGTLVMWLIFRKKSKFVKMHAETCFGYYLGIIIMTVVVYIAPDGSYEECKTTVNADGSISFETDHFSKYAVIGINEEESDDRLGTGAIIAIIIGALLIVGAGGLVIYWFVIKKKAKPTEESATDTAYEEQK